MTPDGEKGASGGEPLAVVVTCSVEQLDLAADWASSGYDLIQCRPLLSQSKDIASVLRGCSRGCVPSKN